MAAAGDELRDALRSVAGCLPKHLPCHVLFAGEKNAGKTALLGLFAGLADAAADRPSIDEILRLHRTSTTLCSGSATQRPVKKEVRLHESMLEVFDLPGFTAPAGTQSEGQVDQVHDSHLIEAMQQAQYVSGVLLVVNGLQSRMQPSIEHELKTISSRMPSDILDKVIVVFTHVDSAQQCQFPVAELRGLFKKEPTYVYLENPVGRLSPMIEAELRSELTAPGADGDEGKAAEIRRDVKKGAQAAISILKVLKGFNPTYMHMTLQGGLDNAGAALESFFSGGTVSLEPQPMAFGNTLETDVPTGKMSSGKDLESGAASGVAGGAAAAAAAAGLAASALMGGKLGDANGMLGQALAASAVAAVPTSLAPIKEKAGALLQKARPWREFVLPLVIPQANEACSRVTGNLYLYQTNYAILFVLQLMTSILWQPSALVSIGITAAAWFGFIKKNEDPEWYPEVGGMKLGPKQRWVGMTGCTMLFLLFMVGGIIINACFMFVLMAVVHGVVHTPASGELPGESSAPGDAEVPL